MGPHVRGRPAAEGRQARRWWFAGRQESPTILAPELIGKRLTCLHTELEATRALCVAELLQLEDASSHDKAQARHGEPDRPRQRLLH